MTCNNQQQLPINQTAVDGNVSSASSLNSVNSRPKLSRRAVLATAGLSILAGCLGGADDDTATDDSDVLPDIPRVEDPPSAVYVPTHRETMGHLPTISVGDYALSPMITYPHQFWTVTGNTAELVQPDDRRGVHLMVSPWDPDTEQVLPIDSGASFRVLLHGDVIETVTPWPMLSQTMGFHFGDNLRLPMDDVYTVEIELPPISARKENEFSDKFNEAVTGSFEFVYDDDLRHRLVENVEYLEEAYWGQRGALEPLGHGDIVPVEGRALDTDSDDQGHAHDHEGDALDTAHDHDAPFSTVPDETAYPGTVLGVEESGDAQIVVVYLTDSESLLVSPRTPYNAIPLADMAMSVSGAIEGHLEQTIDPALGLHYRIDAVLNPGDSVTISIDSPPQVSRHAGYETSFLDMDAVEVSYEE